jgi:hypothetical protein
MSQDAHGVAWMGVFKWCDSKEEKERAVNTDEVMRLVSKYAPETILHAEDWDEDNTPFRPILYLHASSYQVEQLFPVLPAWPEYGDSDYVLSPRKNFAYRNILHPLDQTMSLNVNGRKGLVFWTEDVVIPALIDMKIAAEDGARFFDFIPEQARTVEGVTWMSLTPNEVLTQRSGIQAAEGTVVVGGLGLGWFLRKVCEKDSVEKVILVEKSRELLDWYGYDLCNRYEKVTEVVCDDVYSQIGKHGPVKYLLDIWPIYHGARQDSRYRSAKRKLGKRLWAWGIN